MPELSTQEITAIEPIFSWKANLVGEDWWKSDAKRSLERTVAASILLGTPYLGILLLAMGLNYTNEGSPVLYKNRLSHPHFGDVSHLKIRTMIPGREEDEKIIIQNHGQLHPQDWVDPRVTKVGRILRRHSLDELPQLITSVLCGKENMVGFRIPGQMEYREIIYPNQHKEPYRTYLFNQHRGLRSSLTSLASVFARDEPMETRLLYDNYWATNCTMWSDLSIIAQTFLAPFRRNGR